MSGKIELFTDNISTEITGSDAKRTRWPVVLSPLLSFVDIRTYRPLAPRQRKPSAPADRSQMTLAVRDGEATLEISFSNGEYESPSTVRLVLTGPGRGATRWSGPDLPHNTVTRVGDWEDVTIDVPRATKRPGR